MIGDDSYSDDISLPKYKIYELTEVQTSIIENYIIGTSNIVF